MANETRLFVYGTLKRGDVRSYLLNGQRYLGQASTTRRYRLFNTGDYPALVEAEPLGLDGLAIRGDFWSVDEACLSRLDLEEGVDEGLYERRAIVLSDDHAEAVSYFYLLPVQGMADCGEWWEMTC